MATVISDRVEVLDQALEGSRHSLIMGAKALLQTIFEKIDSPDILRRTLSYSTAWHWRTGITVEQALLSPGLTPQWIAALMALGARIGFGEQYTDEGLLTDFFNRADAQRGRISYIRIPFEPPGRCYGEAHVGRTPTDEPIVAAVAVIDTSNKLISQARLALTGAWREHARLAQAADLLIGNSLTEDHIYRVAQVITNEVDPPDDFLGSPDYRRVMSALMTCRALRECML